MSEQSIPKENIKEQINYNPIYKVNQLVDGEIDSVYVFYGQPIIKKNEKEIIKKIFTPQEISGIKNIYFTNENNEWFIETDGTNFQELLGHPIVNMEKLQSNNVWDIFETLGIEAAREFLIQEFLNIMDGINICHVKLLVEKMTYSGTISSISRYTLRKDESGPMAKSSWNIIHGLVIPKVLLVYSYFVSNTSKLRGYLVRSLILNYLRN